METIQTYLENMFAAFPKTERLLSLKAEILGNMEERYQELKADGSSENEAIGRVISEFGNIEELVSGLGIELEQAAAEAHQEAPPYPALELEEVESFLEVNQGAARLTACGVALVLFGVSLLVFLGIVFEHMAVGVILLFLCIAPAVALFINAGYRLTPYEYIERGEFTTTPAMDQLLRQRAQQATLRGKGRVILGVMLCLMAPVLIFAASLGKGENSMMYGVCLMFWLIAAAVWQFISGGADGEAYDQLLRREEYAPKGQKAEKIIGVVASIVWPLAVVCYLLLGFLGGFWHPGWVIFPALGILFGVFSAVLSAVIDE